MKRYIPLFISFLMIPVFPCVYGFLKLVNRLPEIFIQKQTLILSLFCLFMIGFIIRYFLVLTKILKSERTALEVEVLQKSRKLQLTQEKRLEEIQKHATINQETIMKQLYTLQQTLKEKDTEKIQTELADLTTFCQSRRLSQFCSDSLLNAILLCKKEEAEEAQISTDFQMFLMDSVELPVYDLVTIFFNLLDNGIEACRNSLSDMPFLILKAERRLDFLHIKMINSKNADIHFNRTTTKTNTAEHGFGLSIMEHVVTKYDGICQWLDHGDTFESKLMLHLPHEVHTDSGF